MLGVPTVVAHIYKSEYIRYKPTFPCKSCKLLDQHLKGMEDLLLPNFCFSFFPFLQMVANFVGLMTVLQSYSLTGCSLVFVIYNKRTNQQSNSYSFALFVNLYQVPVFSFHLLSYPQLASRVDRQLLFSLKASPIILILHFQPCSWHRQSDRKQ